MSGAQVTVFSFSRSASPHISPIAGPHTAGALFPGRLAISLTVVNRTRVEHWLWEGVGCILRRGGDDHPTKTRGLL